VSAGRALIVFLKHPTPGRVKTRLAAALGEADAAGVYRALAEELMRRTRSERYRRLAFHAPGDSRSELEAWLPGEEWHPQQGRDLGERMSRAFDTAFASGAERVAIVGSDLPWLGEAQIASALAGLEADDCVVGPSSDGGYYLLGLRRPAPALFRDVAWSTGSVLEATLARARELGLSVASLETRSDVDTLEDLREQWSSLRPLFADTALAARVEDVLGAW
jgi:rSAM/selenodomain-associated transferase 1